MKKKSCSGYLKLLILVISAMFVLCSCGQIANAASGLASAVASSAGNAISSAISEGLNDITEGLGEIKDGLNEAKDNLSSAGAIISEKIGNIGSEINDSIGSELSEAAQKIGDEINDASEDISDASKIVSDELGDICGIIADKISSGISEAQDQIVPTTSASSDDTTGKPVDKKSYTFRTNKLYNDHYEKHGEEFGKITKAEYLELANELINSDSDRVLHKYSDDGDYMYFDQDSGYFLVLSEDGYIRTFFIPTAGIKYWNRQ